MIVGLCGKAGAGKDTAATALIQDGYKGIALADPIKRVTQDVWCLTHKEVHDRVEREKPHDKMNGRSVRETLQYVGTEMFRHDDDEIWIKHLCWKIEGTTRNIVITDIRFPNEASRLREWAENNGHGFLLIRVERDGADGQVGLEGHASEAHDLEGDVTISNNGTVMELWSCVREAESKYNPGKNLE